MSDTTTDIVYLYGLIDPRTYRCRYIGISEDPAKRLIQHKSKPTSYQLRGWIEELKQEGKTPYLDVLLECDSWTQARCVEEEWIKTLALSNDLLNVRSNPLAEKNGATPGPKPKDGEPVRRYSISIRPSQAKRLIQLGEGNLSSGIRRALHWLEETFENEQGSDHAPLPR